VRFFEKLWHQKFGHVNYQSIQHMATKEMVNRLQLTGKKSQCFVKDMLLVSIIEAHYPKMKSKNEYNKL
jgi:hypothetical protein